MTKHAPREELDKLLKSFGTAMLITRTPDGALRGRPMGISRIEGNQFWFLTGSETGKIDELGHDGHAAVVMQDAKRFVSISGNAEIVTDAAETAELWSEASRPWFPEGPKDPKLVAIRVQGETAEYWDMSGLAGARYVFKAVQHALKKERMAEGDDKDVHARMQL
jgi:general stress protein 26